MLVTEKQSTCPYSGREYLLSHHWKGVLNHIPVDNAKSLMDFLLNPAENKLEIGGELFSHINILNKYYKYRWAAAFDIILLCTQPWRFPFGSEQFYLKSNLQVKDLMFRIEGEKEDRYYSITNQRIFIDEPPEYDFTNLYDGLAELNTNYFPVEEPEASVLKFCSLKRIKEFINDVRKEIEGGKSEGKEGRKFPEDIKEIIKNIFKHNCINLSEEKRIDRTHNFPGRNRKDQDPFLGFSSAIDTENLFSFLYQTLRDRNSLTKEQKECVVNSFFCLKYIVFMTQRLVVCRTVFENSLLKKQYVQYLDKKITYNTKELTLQTDYVLCTNFQIGLNILQKESEKIPEFSLKQRGRYRALFSKYFEYNFRREEMNKKTTEEDILKKQSEKVPLPCPPSFNINFLENTSDLFEAFDIVELIANNKKIRNIEKNEEELAASLAEIMELPLNIG